MASSREPYSDRSRQRYPATKTPAPLSLEAVKKRFNNLPASVTSLIGRASEIQAVSELLHHVEMRLLTMTGTGGIGKTRLALACAEKFAADLDHEVCFVSLVAETNSDSVLQTLLQTLGLKEQSNLSLRISLKHALQNRQMLLILDNFEHLIDAAPLLLDLLQSCPDLKLLITSRAILHIPGEHVFPVPPLAVPNLKRLPENELLENPSLILFVERARALKPGFRVTAGNAATLARICQRLDGLPLALELAAARINLLSPQQLLERLTPCLDLLSQQGPTIEPRHQTIRQTIMWSYNLLSPQEQQLLCCLSIFVDGCNLVDIEAFYTLLGEPAGQVLNRVSSLLDKSLLVQRQSEGEETRLGMLETIREFGKDKLREEMRLEKLRALHASYYASFVPPAEPAQLGMATGELLTWIKHEYKNVLAAFHFFEENQQYEQVLRLATGIGGIWFVNGYGSEGLEEMARILQASQSAQEAPALDLYALALALAAGIAVYHGNFPQAQTWYQNCLTLCEQTGDNALLALATAGVTLVATDLGQYDQVATLLDAAIARLSQDGPPEVLPRLLVVASLVRIHHGLFHQAQMDAEASIQLASNMPGQEWSLACALYISGWVEYLQGSWQKAYQFGQESVALLRKLSFPVFALEALCLFAYETAAIGDLTTACELGEEALTLAREAEDITETGRALCGLGYLALRRSDLSAARQRFEESLQTLQQIRQLATRFIYIPASSLEGLAIIAIAERKATYAATLLGAADTLRNKGSHKNRLGQETAIWKRTEQTTMNVLGTSLFTKTFSRGQRLTPWQAVNFHEPGSQRSPAAPPVSAQETSGVSSQQAAIEPAEEKQLPFGDHLTRREMDVIRLLAEGLTNAQIAEKLFLSVVTVNSYLRSIYSKLDVSSRTAAIRYVWDNHLL